MCLQGLKWELLVVQSLSRGGPPRPEAGHSVHTPFPGVDNEVGQPLSGAKAQARPAPRENPVFGYKLTHGRAMALENQATPAKWSVIAQWRIANSAPASNGRRTVTLPRPLLSLTKCPQFLRRRNKVQIDFTFSPCLSTNIS